MFPGPSIAIGPNVLPLEMDVGIPPPAGISTTLPPFSATYTLPEPSVAKPVGDVTLANVAGVLLYRCADMLLLVGVMDVIAVPIVAFTALP